MLERFNRTFLEMLRDLSAVFPTDPDLKLYQMAVRTTILVNEAMVRDIVHSYVAVPYGDRLMQKDESFFLTFDYSEVAAGDQEIMAIVQKLRDLWVHLNGDNKEAVWRYLRMLILLDRKMEQ